MLKKGACGGCYKYPNGYFCCMKRFQTVILQKSEIKFGKFVPMHFVKGYRGVER